MPAGRPLKYAAADDLEKAIQYYFDSITKTEPVFESVFDYEDEEGKAHFKQVPLLNNAGEQVCRNVYFENPSILGMCRSLNLHRDNLIEYEKREEFHDIVKRAKAKVEEFLAEQLQRKEQVAGIIFNLKNNFGWKDKFEQEITGPGGGPLQIATLSDDELDEQLSKLGLATE